MWALGSPGMVIRSTMTSALLVGRKRDTLRSKAPRNTASRGEKYEFISGPLESVSELGLDFPG
jgi:hypothetical protein